MPWGLERIHNPNHLHFLTFSCHHRLPLLNTPTSRNHFVQALERTRRLYHFDIHGYVVMPEHVHLLVSEPPTKSLPSAIQTVKQLTSQHHKLLHPFWLTRYYDFNVHTEKKRIEKLRYIHRNPVIRELVTRPEDWEWSSFRHYSTGEPGIVRLCRQSDIPDSAFALQQEQQICKRLPAHLAHPPSPWREWGTRNSFRDMMFLRKGRVPHSPDRRVGAERSADRRLHLAFAHAPEPAHAHPY